MKIIIRAEDIKKHQVLRNKFISISQEMTLSGKYLTLFFHSELMKEFIMPLIEKKIPYLLVNDSLRSQVHPHSTSEQHYININKR
jgi:hypothetical protein